MQTYHVELDNASYDIYFAPGALDRAGVLLRGAGLSGRAAVITTPTVRALYGQRVFGGLREAGFVVHALEMPEGEVAKNLSTVAWLYDECLGIGLERGDVVVALGGGVVGDTAGFVAATYLRGLPFVQMPTTLLAQVDASIGGKVAVDHPKAKNIIGAFYQPRLVICDPLTLETLPPEEFRSGIAEVIKAGMIRAPRLFAQLEEAGAEPLAPIVAQAIAVKVEVVAADPLERGLREILNFGHTVGHGIESASKYELRHGDAVSLGMVAATRMAVTLGICVPEVEQRLWMLLRRFGLPVKIGHLSREAVWQAMAADKKKRQGRLRFVLPKAIGEVEVRGDVPEAVVRAAIASVVEEAEETARTLDKMEPSGE